MCVCVCVTLDTCLSHCSYVGKAYKLRKRYHKRKAERERREKQVAAENLGKENKNEQRVEFR